jgi:ABC-type lipoprotein release transport system permease subunit
VGILLRMSWRNVWRNWRRTIIAVVAISLGLVLLLIFDGMLGGAEQAMYGNVVKLQGGNVQIHAPGYREKANRMPLLPLADAEAVVQAALAQPQVIEASRRINTGGMVSSHEGTFPVAIVGIEPEAEAPVGLLADNIAAGRYLTAQDGDELLIGQALADQLEVSAGDRVTLVGRATHEQMRSRTMTIVGIYDLGVEEVEKGMVYNSLAAAQALYDLRDQATEVDVALRIMGQEGRVVPALRDELPGYEVDPWYVTDPTTKQTMEMEKGIMSLFGLVILVIAGVGILNLLLMAVFERTREIGIMAAMGMKRWETMVLFLLEGTFIGLLGAAAGCIVGGLINLYFGQVGLPWTAQEYSELTALLGDRIYFDVGLGLLLNRGLTVLIIAALAALYPAWQASRREPAEALHYV